MTQPPLPGTDRQKCVASTRGGSRCTRWAYDDTDYCRQHGELVKPRTPTGISEDQQAALFEALKDGLALDQAVIVAGASRSTVYDWLRRAKEAGAAPEYEVFAATVELARTQLERKTLKWMAAAAAKGSVPAQRFLLATVNPERHGRAGQLALPTTPKKPRPREEDDMPDNVIEMRPAAGGDGADW